ncbi:MAG: glycoside hydrolase family 2 TIM barrel-domain containing protein [Chitinophagaceae bacterium]
MRTKADLISDVSILKRKIRAGLFSSVFLLAASGFAQAQLPARTVISINDHWQFHKGKSSEDTLQDKWQMVQVPHTWNALDVMDDAPGYYRGVGWYKKRIAVNPSFRDRDVALYFEGAGQEAEVFINGKKAGSHKGGYTGFFIPATAYFQFDGKDNINEILVKVDNSYNENLPPLSADFTFYGGLYRDVYLVAADAVHFSFDAKGSQSVFITTPLVSAEKATIEVKGDVSNKSSALRKLSIVTVLKDKKGNQVSLQQAKLTVEPGKDASFRQQMPAVRQPRLWSPEDPFLYTLSISITDAATGEKLDEVTQPVGFRWFSFDGATGFQLNGKPYKLVGASRHQDYKGLGNAVPDELARKDIQHLKKMGGNFLRVAHYPQDPSILAACDELGILASVEIPLVNEITESEEFYRNSLDMQMEMIRQNFNHPSVVMWCHMNEILLQGRYNNDKPRQQIYLKSIERLAQTMDSIARKTDPYRGTMIAHHGDFEKYRQAGLTAITDVIGWNLYSGWYGGKMEDFPSFLERHHRELPNKVLVVSEYGADADPRIRSFKPIKFDKSVEYTTRFHQYYIYEMLKRPFVAGAMIWNLADFNSETRGETMPHMNNKGLLTADRIAKDPYYLYQAVLTKEPFIKITSSSWIERTGIADSSTGLCVQPLQVASNLDSVELLLNGKIIGKSAIIEALASWSVPFADGKNKILAKGYKDGKWYSDEMDINFTMIPYSLKDERYPFRQINILLGADRYYIDQHRKQVWIPDQAYRPGAWGSLGGKIFKLTGNTRLPYGSDRAIAATDDDPLYQTQQTGIEQYKLDVPQGTYELTLHFAELQGGAVKGLVYNLENSARAEDSTSRIFTVLINDQPVLENFDIARQYGVATAVSKKARIDVKDEKGITLVFKAIKGEPVLNALQVVKID